jgi:hypothetical protein
VLHHINGMQIRRNLLRGRLATTLIVNAENFQLRLKGNDVDLHVNKEVHEVVTF